MSQVVLQRGDEVKINGQESIGEIVWLNGKYAKVAFQFVEVSVSLSKLEKVPSTIGTARTLPQKDLSASIQSSTRFLNPDAGAFSAFKTEIDLHGMTVPEALSAVEQWIDRASLLGHKHLKVIHGKGSGVLRSAIRSYLQSHGQARRITSRFSDVEGEGVTWLEIK